MSHLHSPIDSRVAQRPLSPRNCLSEAHSAVLPRAELKGSKQYVDRQGELSALSCTPCNAARYERTNCLNEGRIGLRSSSTALINERLDVARPYQIACIDHKKYTWAQRNWIIHGGSTCESTWEVHAQWNAWSGRCERLGNDHVPPQVKGSWCSWKGECNYHITEITGWIISVWDYMYTPM